MCGVLAAICVVPALILLSCIITNKLCFLVLCGGAWCYMLGFVVGVYSHTFGCYGLSALTLSI